MRFDDERGSDNVEDRRGQRPGLGGMLGGGGMRSGALRGIGLGGVHPARAIPKQTLVYRTPGQPRPRR